MRVLASFLGLLVGGGIVTPFLISSKSSFTELPKPKNREVEASQPVMVCESQYGSQRYRVNLAFGGDWTPTEGDSIQDSVLKDLYFEFSDYETGQIIDRIGASSGGDAKFKLTLVKVVGGTQAGGKSNLQIRKNVGSWVAVDCSINNFKVIDTSCDQPSGFCNDEQEFKGIEFEWENIQNSSHDSEKIAKGIKIKSGINLGWKDGYAPKAVFKKFQG